MMLGNQKILDAEVAQNTGNLVFYNIEYNIEILYNDSIFIYYLIILCCIYHLCVY